jgi:hypothetical protein
VAHLLRTYWLGLVYFLDACARHSTRPILRVHVRGDRVGVDFVPVQTYKRILASRIGHTYNRSKKAAIINLRHKAAQVGGTKHEVLLF